MQIALIDVDGHNFDKAYISKGHKLRKLQRCVCGRQIFRTCKSFEDYQKEDKQVKNNENINSM